MDIEIRKAATGQGDDYTTGCLLDYGYFDKNYKLTAADVANKILIQELLNKFY